MKIHRAIGQLHALNMGRKSRINGLPYDKKELRALYVQKIKLRSAWKFTSTKANLSLICLLRLSYLR